MFRRNHIATAPGLIIILAICTPATATPTGENQESDSMDAPLEIDTPLIPSDTPTQTPSPTPIATLLHKNPAGMWR